MTQAMQLTQGQRLIWTGQQLEPSAPLYNMALAFRIAGPVDPDVFGRAFDALVANTDVLRLVIDVENGEPAGRVRGEAPADLEILDLSKSDDPEAALRRHLDGETAEPFDMSASLYRSGLVRMGPEDHVWWIVQHHLITDGWATSILFRRMSDLYERAVVGDSLDLDVPSFAGYAAFELDRRDSEAHREAVEYWAAHESDSVPLSFYGRDASPTPSTRTDRVTIELGPERTARLSELGGDDGLLGGVSTFNAFAAVLSTLIGRISGQSSFSVLTPAHNRPSKRFKETAGLFIEVLPMRVEVGAGDTFQTLTDSIGTTMRDLLVHARPGTSAASANRNASVLLNLVNTSLGRFNGWSVESTWIHPGHGDRDHALRIQIHDFDETGSWTIHFDMRRDVFDAATERRFVADFLTVFDAFLADPSTALSSVELLSEAELARLDEFNDTTSPAQPELAIDRIRAQAAAAPNAVAVKDGDTELDYAALDRRSDELATALAAVAGPSDRVGVHLARSADLIIGLLAVWKAGAAYVPIDTGLPAARRRLILEDSSAVALVSDGAFNHEDLPDGIHVVTPSAGGNVGDQRRSKPTDPAYVIYTSGSTGRPKGVEVSHGALANYLDVAAVEYGRGEAVSFALHSSVGFDLTVTSLFTPLITGGTVVVYPETDAGDLAILDVFADDAVDVVKLTPAHLAVLDDDALRTDHIRTLILGGEDLKTAVAKRAFDAAAGRVELINEYGPTEATVGCMIHRFDPAVDTGASVPIGEPITNARIHVLGPDLGRSPIGVVGELAIGGLGLASGYHDRPDLSAAAFVDVPDLGRIYRSGDLARWTAPGTIEFLGRSDDQVKVKGHRIELGEVESALHSANGVEQAVVQVIETETHRGRSSTGDRLCIRCGLTDAHPDAQLDQENVCQPCRFYEKHQADAAAYFSTDDEFERIAARVRTDSSEADCLMLLSGGKDSTYALYQLVERGLTPVVFSLDNGYISEGAKANIRRAVDDLGLELVWGSTPSMNEIFADSLGQFSNVCQGCFKTIYTLGMNLAHERGIRHIFTGLSRGQIFETRLADLFRIGITDPVEVDAAIVEARRAYHRVDDAVLRCLDTSIFDRDETFEEIELVDFYRYVDVGLSEIYGFLETRAPWVRPSDTGRSTNCLINNTGIFVHKSERGYHNYALPYSWDVRLGHKTRDAALAELDDEIDVTQVQEILDALPYRIEGSGSDMTIESDRRLAAYYVGSEVSPSDVRNHLADLLPAAWIPSYVVPLDQLPLTMNGKVDRSALPDPRSVVRTGDFVEPRTDIEAQLADIWQAVLGVDQVGVTDDFFELGGDSIMNIQIVAKAKEQGLLFSPLDLFESKTVEGLARASVVGDSAAVPMAEGIAEVDLAPGELDDLLAEFGD